VNECAVSCGSLYYEGFRIVNENLRNSFGAWPAGHEYKCRIESYLEDDRGIAAALLDWKNSIQTPEANSPGTTMLFPYGPVYLSLDRDTTNLTAVSARDGTCDILCDVVGACSVVGQR
jgi:hypothetical protein